MKKALVCRPARLEDKAAWSELWQWLIERLDRLHAVFQDRVKTLDIGSLLDAADPTSELG
jgi:hypothetical protein